MTNEKRRDHIKQLTRRRDWLLARIESYEGTSPSYDIAEASAIGWALRIVQHAEAAGILTELERGSGVSPEPTSSI